MQNTWYDVRKKRLFNGKIFESIYNEFTEEERIKFIHYVDKLTYEDIKEMLNKLIIRKCVQIKN